MQYTKPSGASLLRKENTIKSKKEEKRMEPHVRTAVILGISLGKILQTTNPEILTMYVEGGKSYNQIAAQLHIPEKHNVTEKIAMNAVRNALHGNSSGIKGFSDYPALSDPETLERAMRSHHLDNSKKVGAMIRDAGIGIHALTMDERIEIGRRAGKTSYQRRHGVHALTREQLQEIGRRSAIARGQILWIQAANGKLSELEFILSQASLEENQYKEGGNKGRPVIDKIRIAVNQEYHQGKDVRSKTTVVNGLLKIRKEMANAQIS